MGTYLIIVLDFVIIGIGYLHYKSYINKCIFYSDLLIFSQSLNNSVLLLNTPILKAVEEYNFKNKYNKNKILHLINGGNIENQNTNTSKDGIFSEIKTHFNLIANSFGEQTKEHIENLEQTIKQKLAIAQKDKKEKGMLYFKLSIILALALTILMF